MTTPVESLIVSTMRLRHLLLTSSILLLTVLFSACPNTSRTTAVLCTNRPEFTAYAESFNTAQDEYRIIISYDDKPRQKINGENTCDFDLIIDFFLNSREYLDRFASLEGLFLEEQLDPDLFYQPLFQQGRYENQQVLLPISFNLPALMFNSRSDIEIPDSFMLSLDRLSEMNTLFSSKEEETFTTLGLSLRWDPELLYLVSLLKGTNFRESETGALLWNSRGLKTAVDYIRTWTFETNGGLKPENVFEQKYMVEPPYNLISKNRILCYYSDLSEFYSIPAQRRENLNIRWLAEENQIPVLPGPLFAAIPHGAPGIRGAKAFLTWFLDPENQEKLLSSTRYKRLRTFGIAGGFSSLPAVNEQILPTYYPNLVGYIPSSAYLDFPRPLPPEWPDIKEEVILPWLSIQAETTETDELMGQWIEAWTRQRPPVAN